MRVIDISVPNGPGQHFYPGDPEPKVEPVGGRRRRRLQPLAAQHGEPHRDARRRAVPLPRRRPAARRGRRSTGWWARRGRRSPRAARPSTRRRSRTCRSARRHPALPHRQLRTLGGARLPDATSPISRTTRRTCWSTAACARSAWTTSRSSSSAAPTFRCTTACSARACSSSRGSTSARSEPGRYTLVCLPLKFPELDGAPARAVLLEGVTSCMERSASSPTT